MSPCLAVPWFPPLGSTVFVKVDTVPHTARVPSQEFVVPHFGPGRNLLEPLGVAELTDHIVLCETPDAGFELFHSGMAARQKESHEAARNEETPLPYPCHLNRSPVKATS